MGERSDGPPRALETTTLFRLFKAKMQVKGLREQPKKARKRLNLAWLQKLARAGRKGPAD